MRLVETYLQTGSITETARRWHTSRNVVRKWVERYRDEGAQGLGDRSRRPRRSPARTSTEIEDIVVEAKKATGYGRKRLAWYLWRERQVALSPHTIRHILRRNGFTGRKTSRKKFYPAHWAWEEEQPFSLAQVDVKDVLDKGALGTKLWDHLAKHRLPRYQWTFLEGGTRLRFLAWSHEITLTNGLCFLGLGMLWLRGHGIAGELAWQTDWGEEFGGSDPQKLQRLQEKYYDPVGARLARIPLGRKEQERPGGAIPPHGRRGVLPAVSGEGADRRTVLEEGRGLGVLLQPGAAALRAGDGRETAVPGAPEAGIRSTPRVRALPAPGARSDQCRLGPQGW